MPPGAAYQIHPLLEAGDGFVSINRKLFFSLIIRPDDIQTVRPEFVEGFRQA